MKVPTHLFSGIRDLNPEYLITRYPDMAQGVPAEMYDEKIAQRHLHNAQEIITWINTQIEK